jgi:hypothetical protein
MYAWLWRRIRLMLYFDLPLVNNTTLSKKSFIIDLVEYGSKMSRKSGSSRQQLVFKCE